MTDPSSLAAFQDSFAQALLDGSVTASLAALTRQPGFAVYRNTVMKGCIDALLANFPAVARLVGEPWMHEAAAVYVRGRLPDHPSLLFYGEDFPDFLAQFPPAAELPYLPGVARLDRLWIECHAAQDDHAQDPAVLLSLAPDALGGAIVRPRASARWQWFEDMPVYSIWSTSREGADSCEEPDWTGEGALLVRNGASVAWMKTGAGHCAFLDACAAGRNLAEAATAAMEADRHVDVAQLIAALLETGALSATGQPSISMHCERNHHEHVHD